MDQSENKRDFPPLVTPGFHFMTLEGIQEIAVKPFTQSERRSSLYECLCIFVSLLERFEAPFKIWIDGSFTTEKNEPNDIDLVVLFDVDSVNQLPSKEQVALKSLLRNDLCKARFNLDVYSEKSDNVHGKAYWRGLFGFQRDEETPKGIICLELGNG